jgi:hypothetical protein
VTAQYDALAERELPHLVERDGLGQRARVRAERIDLRAARLRHVRRQVLRVELVRQ